ncbi:hypothetical protein [Absidia glauca]|uniref:PH domain-containing protein n=1 Tax=Absidia glauca TaxID=4829 RepID=A0A168KSF6_ABSGL|nr:hypothetical protein [Absidia glauca]
MSSDLDSVLQDLEKQVLDFSLDIVDANADEECLQLSTQATNTEHSQFQEAQIVSTILVDDDTAVNPFARQSPSDNPTSTTSTILTERRQQVSPRAIGLARTLSAAGTRKFPKKLLPDEPIPCIPPQSSISSPSSSLPSNCVTTEPTPSINSDGLQQRAPLIQAGIEKEHLMMVTGSAPFNHTGTERGPARQHNDHTQYQYQHRNHHQATHPTATSTPETTIIAPTKTMPTRIFIENAQTHKTVQLTNVLTAAMVIQYLKRKELLDNSDDWTLFEIANSHSVERPLRLWEIVMDVTSYWEQNANNALLIKKYSFYESLTANSIKDRPSPVHGWLNIEYKKGKWQKRYCFIKDHAIHYAKDSKCANSAIFCPLAGFDVYTLLQPCSSSPTPFTFTLRAQNRAAIFEKEHDYIRHLTAENQDRLEAWVLGIRQAKSIIHYQEYPERVHHPLAPLTSTTTTHSNGTDHNLRRHKSTKREPGTQDTDNNNNSDDRFKGMTRSKSTSRRITDESIKRNASTRGLSRNNTVSRSREHHSPSLSHHSGSKDVNDFATTGSTMNDGTSTTNNITGSNTLIRIEDKVQFSKGSLLAKGGSASNHSPTSVPATAPPATMATVNSSSPQNSHPHHHQQSSGRTMMPRSKSTREATTAGSHHNQPYQRSQGDDRILSHHTSIHRKDRNQHRQQHDVPLPNTHAILSSSSGNPVSIATAPHNMHSGRVQLHDTPERVHTQALLNRQMKPLLNFDRTPPLDQRRQ